MPDGLVKLVFREGGLEHLMSYTKDKMTIVDPYRNPASTATFAGPLDSPTGTWYWHPDGSDRSTG